MLRTGILVHGCMMDRWIKKEGVLVYILYNMGHICISAQVPGQTSFIVRFI